MINMINMIGSVVERAKRSVSEEKNNERRCNNATRALPRQLLFKQLKSFQ